MEYTSPHIPPIKALLIGGATLVALILTAAFLDSRIQEIAEVHQVNAAQDAAASKTSSVKNCPAAHEMEQCVVMAYYKNKGISIDELQEMSMQYKQKILPTISCPKTQRQLEQCYVENIFKLYDYEYARMAKPGSIIDTTTKVDADVIREAIKNSKSKGGEAMIRSSLNNARAMAELYYDNNKNSYAVVCTNSGGIANNIAEADKNNNDGATMCMSSATKWVAAAQMLIDPKTYYCVDSTGFAKIITGKMSTSMTACPTL